MGDLCDFDRILPSGMLFDFITLTNTVHEIEPSRFARILINCINRLADTGTLFIYDMERIRPPELGAVPWSRDDVRLIIYRMLDGLGASGYRPEVGLWNHRTCNGSNVQVQRQHLGVSNAAAISGADGAAEGTRDEIAGLLKRRLGECQRSLEMLTRYGAATVEEQERKRASSL